MDKETRELIDDMMYDIGELPYRFMREVPAARSLYFNYEKMLKRLAELDGQQS